MSRLDIISDAICEQLNLCADPTTQVALVTFSNKVTILGDGLKTSLMGLNEVDKSETELIEVGTLDVVLFFVSPVVVIRSTYPFPNISQAKTTIRKLVSKP